MIQNILVIAVIAVAVGYGVWRIVRSLRGKGDGCGKNCNC